MQITRGASSWAQIRKTEVSDQNEAGDVVVNAVGVEILMFAAVTVAVGDIIFVSFNLTGVKGLVAGDVVINVAKDSGTGAMNFADTLQGATEEFDGLLASSRISLARTLMFRCTIAGTLAVKVFGSSQGSDWTVSQFQAQGRLTVLRGS